MIFKDDPLSKIGSEVLVPQLQCGARYMTTGAIDSGVACSLRSPYVGSDSLFLRTSQYFQRHRE